MASIDLPEDAVRWAAARVEAGQAPSVHAYFAELARRDRERTEEVAKLQAAIDEGVASGVDPRSPYQIFADARRKYLGPDV